MKAILTIFLSIFLSFSGSPQKGQAMKKATSSKAAVKTMTKYWDYYQQHVRYTMQINAMGTNSHFPQ